MEKVRPHYGKGVSKPSIIFTYQYTENICIHLKDNMCTIYDSRPLMCRSFPVQLGVNGIRFSPGCRAVLDIIPRSKVMNNDLPEVKAAMEMGERLLEFYRDLGENELKWKYNLISEAWEST
jgi:Fe-S-cluster containining protein